MGYYQSTGTLIPTGSRRWGSGQHGGSGRDHPPPGTPVDPVG